MEEGKKATFHNRIEVKKGEWRLKFPGRLDLNFSLAPEFGGNQSAFSPEDLFLSAINSCFFLTLEQIAQELKIDIRDYQSEARVEVGKLGGAYRFLKVIIQPRITVKNEKYKRKTERAIQTTRELCPVFNSLSIPLEILPEINAIDQ